MSIVVLLTLGILTTLNYWICRDARYPPFIMCVLWLFAMCVYYAAPLEINPIRIFTVLIFVTTIIAFSAGALLTLAFHGGNPSTQRMRPSAMTWPSAHPSVKTIFLACSAATLPLIIVKAYQIVSQSDYNIFFIALRLALEENDSSGYGLLGYAAVLSFFTTFLYAIEPRARVSEKLQFYFSLAISLAYAVLSTGRTTVFFIIAVLVGIALMQGTFNFKRLIVSGFVFLLSFVFFAVVTLKGGSLDASVSDNVSSIGEQLLMYDVGPLPGFDQVVRADEPLGYGRNTFLGVLNLIRKVTGKPPQSPIQEFVDVPFPVNVYTGIHPVYKDFGVVGVVFAFAMIGALSTYFYLEGLSGDRLHIFCYGLALFPLFFVTFSDVYFAPMPTWIMYGGAAYLYFRTGKNRQQPLAVS
jgi:oligosaccharide repeat unit polymerase